MTHQPKKPDKRFDVQGVKFTAAEVDYLRIKRTDGTVIVVDKEEKKPERIGF